MSSADRIQAIRRHDLFLVQCQINDAFVARLLVDTGATLTTLSRAFAETTNLIKHPALRQEAVITPNRLLQPRLSLSKNFRSAH